MIIDSDTRLRIARQIQQDRLEFAARRRLASAASGRERARFRRRRPTIADVPVESTGATMERSDDSSSLVGGTR